MKTLKFNKRFYDSILTGDKTLTTRKESRYQFESGEIVTADFGKKNFKIKIVGLFTTGISFEKRGVVLDEKIHDNFFKNEGFKDKNEFFTFLSNFSYKSGIFKTYQFEVVK